MDKKNKNSERKTKTRPFTESSLVLNSFFCECVPYSFPPKLDRPPWFTNELQRLRNLKTNFYKKYKKSGRPSDFSR